MKTEQPRWLRDATRCDGIVFVRQQLPMSPSRCAAVILPDPAAITEPPESAAGCCSPGRVSSHTKHNASDAERRGVEIDSHRIRGSTEETIANTRIRSVPRSRHEKNARPRDAAPLDPCPHSEMRSRRELGMCNAAYAACRDDSVARSTAPLRSFTRMSSAGATHRDDRIGREKQ